MSDKAIAPQLPLTKARDARGERLWIARAMSSFPVPVSPMIRTVESIGATLATWDSTVSRGEEAPTISSNDYGSSGSPSQGHSKQRKLVVQDDSERPCHTIAALGDVGIAEPELEPRDPGNMPNDVEIALTDGWESDAGSHVDCIPPLGVAHEHRKPGDVDTRKQAPRTEVIPGGEAPRFLARLIEIVLLKGEVAG